MSAQITPERAEELGKWISSLILAKDRLERENTALAASNREAQWQLLADKMPPEFEAVLVAWGDQTIPAMRIACWLGNVRGWKEHGHAQWKYKLKPTHWQPLPPPPLAAHQPPAPSK